MAPIIAADLEMFLATDLSFLRGDGRYRGRWSCNVETDQIAGNPADSAQVEDLMHMIKNKLRASSVTRDHAEAMKIEDLRKMMNWSLQQCPPELVDGLLAQVDSSKPLDVSLVLHVTKHLQIRGFSSSAFVLWMR